MALEQAALATCKLKATFPLTSTESVSRSASGCMPSCVQDSALKPPMTSRRKLIGCVLAVPGSALVTPRWVHEQVQTEMMGDIHHFAWRARHRNQTVYLNKRDAERFGDWASEDCDVRGPCMRAITSLRACASGSACTWPPRQQHPNATLARCMRVHVHVFLR